MKIKLVVQAPVIIGGKKINSNYIESKDYIQGSVIRAAFAKVIMNHCEATKRIFDKDGNELKNWIVYRDEEACKKCKYASICKKFSEMKFSFFYPEEAEPIPLTSMSCKKNSKHGFIDGLTEPAQCKCKECNSRTEYTSGLRHKDQPYKIEKIIQTKTAVNPYMRTAEDGQLYTLAAVKCEYFTGEISLLEKSELELFSTLRIGAYTTSGYGKCKLTKSESCSSKVIKKEDIIAYSKKYKEYLKTLGESEQEKDNEGSVYLMLLLQSDARISIPNQSSYQTTKAYKEEWHSLLKESLKFEFYIERVYADTSLYRGYDTSKIDINSRGTMCYQVEKGSVFILKLLDPLEQVLKQLEENSYIGQENQNGYGAFKIYCGEE